MRSISDTGIAFEQRHYRDVYGRSATVFRGDLAMILARIEARRTQENINGTD